MRRVTLSLVAALLAVAGLAGPVLAAKPSIERTEIAAPPVLDGFLTAVCDFDVWLTSTGHVILRTWTDAQDNLVREVFTINLHVTISAGGASLHAVDAGMDKVTFLDGGAEQVEIHGNLQLLTVKGHGPVLGAAGRFAFIVTPLFDENGDPILDEEGNQIVDFEVIGDSGIRAEEDLEAVCAALAPPQ